MPGWYVHLEAAKLATDRLRAGDVPADLGLDPAEAARLGALAHTWRNYLAVGALGPDLFFMLPDFKAPLGSPLLNVAEWVLDVWEEVESLILDPLDEWLGPVGANNSDLLAAFTGGVSTELAFAMDELMGAIQSEIMSLLTRMRDLFGLLTSGVPQGLEESAFYWSDLLHYRRTYDVPRVLYRNGRDAEAAATTDAQRLDGQAQQAFALGWMVHCGTDVVGHAFTNAKSGGPFRLHWQRHHLVENHFDAQAYRTTLGGGARYGTIGTSALHFRVSFCKQPMAPYTGREDAPAVDYFGALPAYPTGRTAADAMNRSAHFDLDTFALPGHLVDAMLAAFREVYATSGPDITPEVLETTDPAFSDDGRPNGRAMETMWRVVYRFLRQMSSSGFTTLLPAPPSVFQDHPFPTPPGGAASPAGGAEGLDDDDDGFTLLDLLLAIFAWIIYVAQVVVWLATLPLALLDPATFPVRTAIYYGVVVPMHSLHMAARRVLVMTGFITPEPEEIDGGLVTLGRSSTYSRAQLRADLADPAGFAASAPGSTEPSGRPSRAHEWNADPAYPRDTPRDPQRVADIEAHGFSMAPSGGPEAFSEWVTPWRYPHTDLEGDVIGWEGDLTHAGPFTQGDSAEVLLGRSDTHVPTARDYEGAADPAATEEVSASALPDDRHLGNPVDYTLYLVSRLTAGEELPSFNLDSDRGYAWRCWDWDRHDPEIMADGTDRWHGVPIAEPRFALQQPCSVPAQYNSPAAVGPSPPWWTHAHPHPQCPADGVHEFDALQRRLVHYLDGRSVPGCAGEVDEPVRPHDVEKAQLPPSGRRRER